MFLSAELARNSAHLALCTCYLHSDRTTCTDQSGNRYVSTGDEEEDDDAEEEEEEDDEEVEGEEEEDAEADADDAAEADEGAEAEENGVAGKSHITTSTEPQSHKKAHSI